jgi:UDP-N-acetylmuramoyl-L-alanyl-D-glutamate--2,6-diaminopimelate ligase
MSSFKIAGINITHLTHDSRSCILGSCFFVLSGTKSNGAAYVSQAVSNGAVLIVANKGADLPICGVPVLFVNDVRESMGLFAKEFYGNICDKMDIIGVTGTNGKTTITYIMRKLLGKRVGVIGTLGAYIGNDCIEKSLTTPDPIQLHDIFLKMYKKGIRKVVMEVSAHAIHYKKIAGVSFACGIFTNLTQDHLDFFNTMQEYADTKISFMTGEQVKYAVVNADDESGKAILQKRPDAQSYSIDDVKKLEMSQGNTVFYYKHRKYNTKLSGRFNVMNTLACIAGAKILGVSASKIKKRLLNVQPVAGRFNVFKAQKGFTVVVDYAHTPDGLEKILTSARELVTGDGKLFAVFGCGGNRDKSKREIMGGIAGQNADEVIVTSDNPRDEVPLTIIKQIETGVKASKNKNYKLLEDRLEAIYFAFSNAKEGDVIVIAGKGAETTQEIAGVFYPYSDIETVKDYINKGN